MPGVRSRLAVTLVALVALTAGIIGAGSYLFVEASLRASLLETARREADFDLSVLLPGADPAPVDARAFAASGLPDAFGRSGGIRTLADFGDGQPFEPAGLEGALASLDPALRSIVASGRLGFAWQALDGEPVLVVGGRQGGFPELYFVHSAAALEAALAQLRAGFLAASAVAIALALITAGFVARGILRPVADAGRAARRIAGGDLAARVPVRGRDELARLAVELNRMAASLEQTVANLEEAQARNRVFTADVAHELRTPLAALLAEATLIESQAAAMPPESRRAAELLAGDVRRLRALVDDLLEISRFDAGGEQPAFEPVDLTRVVTAAVASRLPAAALAVPSVPVVVTTDPRRLDRIIGNLLDNARAHAPGAPVEVALTTSRDGMSIVVADRGPGVPADALPHLFDRFYTADAARSRGSSGLGLAIAAEHAALLAGTLRARPRPGGGLVFTLALPVTASLPPGHGSDTRPRDAGGASEPPSRIEP
jgi:two-component system sensor histidine kinase MtrB